MERKKPGPKPSGKPLRTSPVKFFLTEDDAAFYSKFADDLGFKSHSEFWTAVAERLRSGGLAPVVWLKLGYQIAGRAEKTGTNKRAGFVNPFLRLEPLPVEDKPRPTPVLSEEQLTAQETKALLAGLRKPQTT